MSATFLRSIRGTHHLSRLGARTVELHIGILFPVSEQERELEEESVVGIAEGSEGLGARVAVQATLEGLAGFDEVFPVLEVIGVGFLWTYVG